MEGAPICESSAEEGTVEEALSGDWSAPCSGVSACGDASGRRNISGSLGRGRFSVYVIPSLDGATGIR
jgi:hypothetical protein